MRSIACPPEWPFDRRPGKSSRPGALPWCVCSRVRRRASLPGEAASDPAGDLIAEQVASFSGGAFPEGMFGQIARTSAWELASTPVR